MKTRFTLHSHNIFLCFAHRSSDCGSSQAMPDHPWSNQGMYLPKPSSRMDHYPVLHHLRHHLTLYHMWPACDLTVVARGNKICPLDRLHGKYVTLGKSDMHKQSKSLKCFKQLVSFVFFSFSSGPLLYGCPHISSWILHQSSRRTTLQITQ